MKSLQHFFLFYFYYEKGALNLNDIFSFPLLLYISMKVCDQLVEALPETVWGITPVHFSHEFLAQDFREKILRTLNTDALNDDYLQSCLMLFSVSFLFSGGAWIKINIKMKTGSIGSLSGCALVLPPRTSWNTLSKVSHWALPVVQSLSKESLGQSQDEYQFNAHLLFVLVVQVVAVLQEVKKVWVPSKVKTCIFLSLCARFQHHTKSDFPNLPYIREKQGL